MSKNDTPFKVEEIDIKNVLYNNIESNDKKSVVYLKYKKKELIKSFVIQTPTLKNLFRPIKYKNHYELDVPIIGKKHEKISKFVKFLEDLDKKFIYDAKLNAHSWFSKQKEIHLANLNDNKVESLEPFSVNYQKILRESEKYKNGILKIKIINNKHFKTGLAFDNGDKIKIDNLPINYYFRAIIEINALWISRSSFGLFIKPIVLSFGKPLCNLIRYNFLEDTDESDDDIDEVIVEESIDQSNDRIIEKKLILDD